MPQHARDSNRSAADRYRPSHAPVEVPNARTTAERRVGCRHPFEKTAARYREPDQSAKYCVTHQPGLMRQQNDHQARLEERKTHFRAYGTEMAAERHGRAARRDIYQHGNQRRQNNRRQDEPHPDGRVLKGHGRSYDQGHDERRGRQRPPKVV